MEIGSDQRQPVTAVVAVTSSWFVIADQNHQLDRDTGTRVLSVLLEVSEELNAALVVATHDRAVAGRLAVHWRMADGLLSIEKPT